MKNIKVGSRNHHDTLAERSKAVAQGAIPKGRGFEPHRCHLYRTFGICFPKVSCVKTNFSKICCLRMVWRKRKIKEDSYSRSTHKQRSEVLKPQVVIQMHQLGIEPGSHRWQRCILPLDH